MRNAGRIVADPRTHPSKDVGLYFQRCNSDEGDYVMKMQVETAPVAVVTREQETEQVGSVGRGGRAER
jgi:hypothetical protein